MALPRCQSFLSIPQAFVTFHGLACSHYEGDVIVRITIFLSLFISFIVSNNTGFCESVIPKIKTYNRWVYVFVES
jgi:hypothetical protein